MHGGKTQLPAFCAERLFQFPREVRDEIYAYALESPSPVKLAVPANQFIPEILQRDPVLLNESLEVFYRVNSFVVTPRKDGRLATILAASAGVAVNPKDHIRRLIMDCDEGSSIYVTPDSYEEIDRENRNYCWDALYDLPRLQDLTIDLMKQKNESLFTFDFGPIVYDLREKIPGFKFRFSLTFDGILFDSWYDPQWRPENTSGQDYEHMGYVDMTDLIEPPTDEDVAYVQEFLKDFWEEKRMPKNRSIEQGLLDEFPPQRRALAKYYAVKEPALLRCLMAEHYKIYKSYRE